MLRGKVEERRENSARLGQQYQLISSRSDLTSYGLGKSTLGVLRRGRNKDIFSFLSSLEISEKSEGKGRERWGRIVFGSGRQKKGEVKEIWAKAFFLKPVAIPG